MESYLRQYLPVLFSLLDEKFKTVLREHGMNGYGDSMFYAVEQDLRAKEKSIFVWLYFYKKI